MKRAVVTTFAPVSESRSTSAAPDPFCPGRHQRATTGELNRNISNRDLPASAILSPSSVKLIPRFMGCRGSAVTRCDSGHLCARAVYREWLACTVILCRGLGLQRPMACRP